MEIEANKIKIRVGHGFVPKIKALTAVATPKLMKVQPKKVVTPLMTRGSMPMKPVFRCFSR